MWELENSDMSVVIHEGLMKELYDKKDKRKTNLSDPLMYAGSVGYTLKEDDIRSQTPTYHRLFEDRVSHCLVQTRVGSSVQCQDENRGIWVNYSMDQGGLTISAWTDHEEISQFALNLDLNFLGKKGTDFHEQLLPSSTYVSDQEEFAYCIMTRPNGRTVVAVVMDGFAGFKMGYSEYCYGHFIERFQWISSYDKAFLTGKTKNQRISVKLFVSDSVKQAEEMIYKLYQVPYCKPIVSGNFSGKEWVLCSEDTDYVKIIYPNGSEKMKRIEDKYLALLTEQEGFCRIIPFNCKGKQGMDTVIWSGTNLLENFNRCAKAIKGPEVMKNSCERGVYLWTKLCNMRVNSNLTYESEVKTGFARLIGNVNPPLVGATILPYRVGDNAAYHLYGSDRVQNDFFLSSYLLEAYRVFKDRYYLEYAVAIMLYLAQNRIKSGCVISTYSDYSDYTTVCAPIINVIDLANELKALGDSRYHLLEDTASSMADYLWRRGYHFPTECSKSDKTEFETEDGSISCTALSLLYYCTHVRYIKEYADFARDIIKLHNAWTIYTPDVRMYRSSFRWWETIWEGDQHGPTVNAGHAWTIWRGEATYYLGILDHDESMMLDSWNSYVTNFCKIRKDGQMEACFEPDYIVSRYQSEDDYTPWHRYPKAYDTSLTSYVWSRTVSTWLTTCMVTEIAGHKVVINAEGCSDGINLDKNINICFVGTYVGILKLYTNNTLRILLSKEEQIEVKQGYNVLKKGKEIYITAENGCITLLITS